MHELPPTSDDDAISSVSRSVEERSGVGTPSVPGPSETTSIVVNTALLARIEALEAEKRRLEKDETLGARSKFRIEDIQHDDNLVRFYTGFISFFFLSAFFEFLGPVVNKLNYWGAQEGPRRYHRARKLNQLFMTLIKLKNLLTYLFVLEFQRV